MKSAYRRSSGDKKWSEVKEAVFARDTSCRLLKVLSLPEAIALKRLAGSMVTQLDAAHYLPVGQYGEYCYDVDNIVALNHYSHSFLDDFRDPITGQHISEEKVKSWWMRILKGNIEQYENLRKKGLIEG